MSARPTWIAVVAGVVILAYITFNTLSTPGAGSRGPAPGAQMRPFAAPLVTSDLVGDANVATRKNHGNAAGAVPACSVQDPRALNSCTLARRGPVVLAFLTGSKHCVAELDAMQAIAPRYPQVGFAAVAVRGDRGALRTLVREHGWRFPVAQDRDGAVANLYGVAICPTVVLAYRGGRVMRTALAGEVATPATLARAVRALLAGPPAGGGTRG
ncbi:MAG TPA: TlpA disulfide reductase family protein [Conexibacter sp.]|nr:TlpA disulfide reductase family protein [Conexibacter sp.]